MDGLIGLDFETYGAVSLPKHGLHRYMSDKSFTPLICSAAWTAHTGTLVRNRFDFVNNMRDATESLRLLIGSASIVAHNAGFEEAVLHWLGLVYPSNRFIDSAVIARAAGAGGHLEAAAPQLLDVDKLASGKHLMRLFSMPGEYQEKSGSDLFDPAVILDHPAEWDEYGEYCDLDAELGLRVAEDNLGKLTAKEMNYQAVTMEMNRRGWPVDRDVVEEMHRRYLENQLVAEQDFKTMYPDSDINLNSLKQMKEWCAKRGIKATSFDEKHVASLLDRIEQKLASGSAVTRTQDYEEVCHLLRTKQVLGGSSLKKLAVILDTIVEDKPGDWRLKDQYVHCGAGQTLRTSGRSVQMQNLKQLSVVSDMTELADPDVMWDNGKLAENLRQVFTSSDSGGRLIVGDFKSVESRGLAYMAGEAWKMNAYRKGEDIYQLLADRFGNTRKFGKVGELSCGYGAGSGAVQSFAAGMGIELSEGEATKLVYDWRDACPRTLDLWSQLNRALRRVVEGKLAQSYNLDCGLTVTFRVEPTPATLLRQNPGVISVGMIMSTSDGVSVMKRYFHGCYMRGRNVAYYKPSDRKTGDLWRATFTDPKTKQLRYYELYGGKLAGILTQSLCREIFMHVLHRTNAWWRGDNVTVVGQFHDEIVLDWKPGAIPLHEAEARMGTLMSTPPAWLAGFPLDAEIKSDYRYIK